MKILTAKKYWAEYNKEMEKKILLLLQQNATYKHICNICNCSMSTISKIKKKYFASQDIYECPIETSRLIKLCKSKNGTIRDLANALTKAYKI